MMVSRHSQKMRRLHQILFIGLSYFLTSSTAFSSVTCADLFSISPFTFSLPNNELPKNIFSTEGFEVFRGLSVSATDSQIASLLQKDEPSLARKLPKENFSSMSVEELAPYVLQHASGISIKNSLFHSSTFDIGVANYFSTQGQGQRSLILHFTAPSDSINVTAFSRKRPFPERGEAEVMVPFQIPAQNIIQILEIDHSSGRSVIVGRWFRQNSEVVHESVNNAPLPHPRRRTILKLSY